MNIQPDELNELNFIDFETKSATLRERDQKESRHV